MSTQTTKKNHNAKSIRQLSSNADQRTKIPFDAKTAGLALADGLDYLKQRLGWSGTRIANLLHLPPNTVNNWLKNSYVPLHSEMLQPDIQAIIHLLAIHRSLDAMFEEPAHQLEWLKTFHPTLKVIPEQYIATSIEGLIFIRQYLDYVRGRGA